MSELAMKNQLEVKRRGSSLEIVWNEAAANLMAALRQAWNARAGQIVEFRSDEPSKGLLEQILNKDLPVIQSQE